MAAGNPAKVKKDYKQCIDVLEMRSDIIILSLNFALYFITFRRLKSSSLLSIGSVTFLLYTFLALMSLIMVVTSEEKPLDLNFFALLYLYVCILISYKPLASLNQPGLKVQTTSTKPLNVLLTVIVVFSVARFPEIVNNFSKIITGFLLDSNVFYDQYNTAMETYTQVQSNDSFNVFAIILGMFDRYIPFFLMYYLTLQKRNKLLTFGLVIGLVIAPMHGLIEAQRGVLVDVVLSCVVAYALFKDSYSDKLNKIVRITGLSFVAGVAIALSMITVSRFSQSFMADDSVQRSVYAYAGQTMTNFGEYGFDTGGIRHGDRTIPLIKKVLFMDGAFDYAHRMEKYQYLKLNEGMFSTYVGDLVVDFGPVLAFLIIVIMTFMFSRMIVHKGRVIPMYKLIPAYILGYIILCGWHLYPFADFGGNLSLFIGFVLYFYFRRYYIKQKKNILINNG